jgi:hypothetical protein
MFTIFMDNHADIWERPGQLQSKVSRSLRFDALYIPTVIYREPRI